MRDERMSARQLAAVVITGLTLGIALSCSPSTGGDSPGGGGGTTSGGGNSSSAGAGQGGATSNGGGDQGSGGDTFFSPDAGLIKHEPDAGCAGITSQGEELPLDLYIMFDQSASMSCAVGSTDRWTVVKQALGSFVNNPGAAGIDVGLGYFGTAASPPGSDCDPSKYQPDVEIAPLSSSAAAITASLDAHHPLTDTPTLPALQAAIMHAGEWKAEHSTHTVVVVLVTDGEPNACGANSVDEVVTAAKKGFEQGGIATYLIGILSPGEQCTLDPNQPNQSDLDSVAKAGGTNSALIVDTTTTDAGQQFLDTMNKIRQTAQVPCEYQIPPPEKGKDLAYDHVNVSYQDPDKNAGPPVYYVETKDKCDPATGGGWYYDVVPNPPTVKPTKILLCPDTCTTITSKFGYITSVQVGCQTKPPPR
jgi:hypothetical protein